MQHFLISTVTQEALVDSAEKIVTTPAFMCDAGLHDIFDGIGAMISQILKLTWCVNDKHCLHTSIINVW